MSEFWEKVSFKNTPKRPKKIKIDFYKRKKLENIKPSKIYVVFESEDRSPMEILTPILDFAKSLGIKTPDYLALDYPGCDDPCEISIKYTEVRKSG